MRQSVKPIDDIKEMQKDIARLIKESGAPLSEKVEKYELICGLKPDRKILLCPAPEGDKCQTR